MEPASRDFVRTELKGAGRDLLHLPLAVVLVLLMIAIPLGILWLIVQVLRNATGA